MLWHCSPLPAWLRPHTVFSLVFAQVRKHFSSIIPPENLRTWCLFSFKKKATSWLSNAAWEGGRSKVSRYKFSSKQYNYLMNENQVHVGPVAGRTICPNAHSFPWCAHLLATLCPFQNRSIPSHCGPPLYHTVVKLTSNCRTFSLGKKAKSDELVSDEKNKEGTMVPWSQSA